MCLIATQSYIKIERVVSSTNQKNIISERLLLLYKDKIVTRYRTFAIQEITDLSYRLINDKWGGLLYIHTTGGVFSYNVKSPPHEFIFAFRNLKRND